MSKTDSRTIEKLIACLRYELEHNPLELAGEVFQFAQEQTLDPDWQPDYEDETIPDEVKNAAIERIRCSGSAMAEALFTTLAANGDHDAAAAFLESIAARRRQCEAKYKLQRDIPFSDEEEREELARQWDAAYEESRAPKAVQ